MSHFSVLVLTESGEESEVERLLAPYDENGEWFADDSRWDWWVVGGRWTGLLDPEYDPYTDPENQEECWLCHGTGKRDDDVARGWRLQDPTYTCNGCEGTGRRLKHSPDFKPRGNTLPVADLVRLDPMPTTFALVTPNGRWQEKGRMGWFGMTRADEQGDDPKPERLWESAYRAALDQYPDAIAVVVDCHV